MRGRRSTGQQFEAKAASLMRAAGLTVLENNYRCKTGEIDLICRDGDVLVFVEVRFRRRSRFATAATSIDSAKQRRLLLTAQYYLQQRGLTDCQPCRFDVVAFDGATFDEAQTTTEDAIQWVKDAITL